MSYTLGYNTPVVDASSCRSLFECIQICEIRDSKITFRKRPLPVNNPLTHTNGLTESVAKLRNIFEITKLLSKKGEEKDCFFDM